jgi:hypothetical protein
MSIQITREIVIARPRPLVAGFAMVPENEPRWIGAVCASRALTAGPLHAGQRLARTTSFLGRRFEQLFEVVSCTPETSLRLRSLQGPVALQIEYDFADAGAAATRTRVTLEGEPGRFFPVPGRLLAHLLGRAVERDLRALRSLLEEET